MDPYQILGVKYSATMPEIREQFKKLVLHFHPDRKYGDARKFQAIKRAYNVIYNHYMTQKKNQKRAGMTFEDYIGQRKETDSATEHQMRIRRENLDNESFNCIFEKTKVNSPFSVGRESFLNMKEPDKKLAVQLIAEPKPAQNIFEDSKELGVDVVNDFSTYDQKRKTKCADIKHAYKVKDISQSMPNTRQDSHFSDNSQLNRLQNLRENMNYEMTPYEIQRRQKLAQQERDEEAKRQFNIARQAEIAERQFFRVQKYIAN